MKTAEQDILLTGPQFDLVATEKQFPAFVGGLGSGKTKALITRLKILKVKYPYLDIGYYLPTYDLVNTIAFPRWEEELASDNIPYKTVKSQTPMIRVEGAGNIIMRTMDRPARIVGYEVGHSGVDELDTLKQVDAKNVWTKILARNRQKPKDGSKNTIAVATTPEGFRFVYDQWYKKPPSDQYELIRASTYSNARNLPADYIKSMEDAYPPQLLQAYLNGEFVNLTSGSVYPNYDRKLNASTETVREGDALHIGMDFNVMKMAAVVYVYRNGEVHAVAELTNVRDTPTMIQIIQARSQGHTVFIYPDATGQARKSVNASVSDIALLRAAGFNVLVNPTNPFVKDRVLSMNVLLHKRQMRVNADRCPVYADALEKQAYDDNGEPDKTAGFDHINDAGGYFICYRFPVTGPAAARMKFAGN
jgi:hypothetical protein